MVDRQPPAYRTDEPRENTSSSQTSSARATLGAAAPIGTPAPVQAGDAARATFRWVG